VVKIPVEVITEPIRKPSIIAQIIVLVVKYWLVIVAVFAVCVILAFVILLWKKMKKRVDPFKDVYNRTKALCKFHRNPAVRHIYMVSEDRLQYVGKYLGECITQDGYNNIMFWKGKKWYLFWIPARFDFLDLVKEIFIMKCNVNKKYKVKIYNQETKVYEDKEYDVATDLIKTDGDKIIIKGLGVERVKYFLYPVLRDEVGNVADKKLEIFDRQRTPALIDTMYSQVEDFANISRELINLNPLVRFAHKTGELPAKRE